MRGSGKRHVQRQPRRADESRLSIEVLGGVTIRVDGKEVRIADRKAKALVGYLAISDRFEEARGRLVGLLWNGPEKNARASFRTALHKTGAALREAGCDGMRASKLSVALNPTSLDVDLWAVLEEAKAGRVHRLLIERERLLEQLMADFETLEVEFRIWLLAKRRSFQDRLMLDLETALARSEAGTADRERLAHALLNLDPTHEEAARVLMRARIAADDMSGALGIYKRLWDRLEDEYEVEPSKETQDLVAQIKLGERIADRARDGEGPMVLPAPTRPSPARAALAESDFERQSWRRTSSKLLILVAEFDGSSIEDRFRHLLQGFRAELICSLVRFREWTVGEAKAVREPRPAAPNVAEYAIEAVVIDSRDPVRLVLNLRDLGSGTFVWSEPLQLSLANWHDAQLLVVRRLATALNVHASAERVGLVTQREITNLKAFDYWLLGQSIFMSFEPKHWPRAIDLFKKVIAEMPDFAPAYSSLAQLHNANHIVKPGTRRDPRITEQALSYARKAAHYDPIDSRSQLCLGWSHAMLKQYDQAMTYIPLAYELNNNDPWTLVSSANCFAFCGEHERAREIAEHALRLPLAPSPLQWSYHVAIRFMESNYVGSLQAAEMAGDVNPNVRGYKAAALAQLGHREAAAVELRHFFEMVSQRWIGPEPVSDRAITRWFLHMFPIRSPSDWARLRDGLAAAGAPVQGLAHHQW